MWDYFSGFPPPHASVALAQIRPFALRSPMFQHGRPRGHEEGLPARCLCRNTRNRCSVFGRPEILVGHHTRNINIWVLPLGVEKTRSLCGFVPENCFLFCFCCRSRGFASHRVTCRCAVVWTHEIVAGGRWGGSADVEEFEKLVGL